MVFSVEIETTHYVQRVAPLTVSLVPLFHSLACISVASLAGIIDSHCIISLATRGGAVLVLYGGYARLFVQFHGGLKFSIHLLKRDAVGVDARQRLF